MKRTLYGSMCRVVAAGLLLMTAPIGAQTGDPAAATEASAASPSPPSPGPSPGPMDLFVAFSRARLATNGFERHEAEVRGQALVWWTKGEGPALVLVHGVSDQAGTWFQVAPALAEKYRVLLVDLPGHGESGPAAGPLPMTRVIEGFESWLSTHGIRPEEAPPTLVGNSMGAWVAMLTALRHPQKVSRVVAVNGGPLRAETGGLDLLPKNREEARALMAALRDADSPPTPDLVLDDLVRRVAASPTSRMFEASDDLENYLLEGRLGEITTPVDLLWGDSDRYLGREYPARLLRELPRARLTRILQCGHLPQAECPARFLVQLQEVLAQDPPHPPKKGESP